MKPVTRSERSDAGDFMMIQVERGKEGQRRITQAAVLDWRLPIDLSDFLPSSRIDNFWNQAQRQHVEVQRCAHGPFSA